MPTSTNAAPNSSSFSIFRLRVSRVERKEREGHAIQKLDVVGAERDVVFMMFLCIRR